MLQTTFMDISGVPALLIGQKSDKVFLFIHGMNGNKEEAESFANLANSYGYQVLGIDIPVMSKPWEVLPLLEEVKKFLFLTWKSVSIRANSIGCWFSLQAFQDSKIERALFVSPILDMKTFIENMPSRENDYYQWVVEHPITSWTASTYILRPKVDMVVKDVCYDSFGKINTPEITILDDGEHWFHTPEQLDFLEEWENRILSQ